MATLTNATLPIEPTDVIIFASRLPLSARRSAPGFLIDTMRIKRQLDALLDQADAGLYWYALRADLGANVYWTASAWRSQSSLSAFVRAEPHVGIMRSLRGKLGSFDSQQWTTSSTALPLPHDSIVDRLTAQVTD